MSIVSPQEQLIMKALYERLERERSAGRVSDERFGVLSDKLRQQGLLLDAPSGTVEDAAANLHKQRDLTASMDPLVDDPSHGLPDPPSGTRAAELLGHWKALARALRELASRTGEGAQTRARARELIAEVSSLHGDILRGTESRDSTRALERERLRGTAAEARRLALSYHLTLAAPLFDVGHVVRQSSRVFFSGPDATQSAVATACSSLGLDLDGAPTRDDYATARWKQLRQAGLGVFAFSGDDTSIRAAVAYEFGLARAVGLPVVVLHDHQRPAFDIAIEAVRLQDEGDDPSRIATAIDEALYGLPPISDHYDGLRATVRNLQARFGDCAAYPRAAPLVRRVAASLDEPDPRAIADAIEAVLFDTGERRLELLQPAWPAVYPEPGQTRVFHVMPFGPGWSRPVSEHVEGLCPAGSYRRHDHNEDRSIIDSLWREVSAASHVVVDLTADDSRGEPRLNENVAVELGFADALGRPVLLVAQRGTVERGLIPWLEKQRIEEYDLDDLETLSRSVRRFVSIAPVPPVPVAPSPGDTARAPIPDGSNVSVRPGLAALRRQFDAALQHDAQSHWLAGWLQQAGHGDPRHVHFLVGVVRGYVSTTADALEGVWRLAIEHGVTAQVGLILEQIEEYCRRLDDIIPDARGLFGVVDDAYLARQIVAGIGWQLRGNVPNEHERTSTWYVRQHVIREPFASQLDWLVDQILRGRPAVTAAQSLAQAGAGQSWLDELGRGVEAGVQSVVDAVASLFGSANPPPQPTAPPPAPLPWFARAQARFEPTHPVMQSLMGLRQLIEQAEAARRLQAQPQAQIPLELQGRFDSQMLDYQLRMSQLDRQSRERLDLSRSSALASAASAGIDVSGWS